jgi:tetratricopeptide (TPR) repeat protein
MKRALSSIAFLMFSGCVTTPESATLPTDTRSLPQNIKDLIVVQIGRELSPQDKRLLESQEWLRTTFETLANQEFLSAKRLALHILDTPDLSETTYQWALSAYAMALIATSNAETWKNMREFENTIQAHALPTIARKDLRISAQKISSQLLKPHVRALAKFNLPEWWSALSPRPPEVVKPAPETLEPLEGMKKHVADKKIDKAATIAAPLATSSTTHCGVRQYARHVMAQHNRKAQNREKFFELQDALIRDMESNPCTAEKFAMSINEFAAFQIDAQLWLARLHWERGENKLALPRAEKMLQESIKIGSPTLSLDAAHLTLGRIGFEDFSPQKNIETASKLLATKAFSPNGRQWLTERLGFFQILANQGEDAANTFTTLANNKTEDADRAEALYWKGRALQSAKKNDEAKFILTEAGNTDPLSYADILAGKALSPTALRASTARSSAFSNSWYDVFKSSVELSPNKPFSPFRENIAEPQNLNTVPDPDSQSEVPTDIATSLRNVQLLTARQRAEKDTLSFDDFQARLRSDNDFFPTLIRQETRSLQNTFEHELHSNDAVTRLGPLVAWHMHLALSDSETILFIGRLRNKLSLENEIAQSLYLLFYPRPYNQAFLTASQKCKVDVNTLYAIARQESLMNPAVKSPVGAVGLMQLLPSTAKRVLSRFPEYEKSEKIDLTSPATNTLAGACYFSDLVARYNGNIFYAIAAYNAGENAVDQWVNRRLEPAKSSEIFIEFIPYNETQKYVKRVYRNLINMNWIYGPQPVVKDLSP